MKTPFLLVPVLLIASVCSASRVSGGYVGHGANFTELLQLTETNNGQISGVISSLTLKGDGTVKSEQAQVTGAVDADQITLKFGSELLSFVFGSTLSGTVSGSTIQLHTVDSKGNVLRCTFVRGTTADFAAYAVKLKSQGTAIILNTRLLNGAQEFRETVRTSENWRRSAEWARPADTCHQGSLSGDRTEDAGARRDRARAR